jgi:hypothetical protein
LLVLKERTTRRVLAARRAGTSAAEIVTVMMAVFGRLDPRLHASVTLDNGTAFARHGLLASAYCSGTGRPSNSPLLSTGIAQLPAARLGGRKCCLRTGADHLTLVLGNGGEDMDGEPVGLREIHRDELDAGLHQIRARINQTGLGAMRPAR